MSSTLGDARAGPGVAGRGRLRRLALAPLIVAVLAHNAQAADAFRPRGAERDQASTELTLEAGVEYGAGNYGGPDRSSYISWSSQLELTRGRWSLALDLSYLELHAPPGAVAIDGTIVAQPGGTAPDRSVSGPGDVVAAASYAWPAAEPADPQYKVYGQVKFGTADPALGLGTGRNDYTLQAERAQTVDAWTFGTSAGHTWIGRIAGASLRDISFAIVEAGRELGYGDTAGARIEFATPLADDLGAASELTLYWQRPLGPASRWRVSLSKGLSGATPDYTVGLVLNLAF